MNEITEQHRIVCGTSGYDYPEWRGVFYPQNLPRPDFLSFYAQHFSALEVNFTFYQMPSESHLRSMMNRSGGKMLFSIKAPQTLTHDPGPDWKNDASLFRAALLPLVNGGVLSAVLFQFPQSFHYEDANRLYLAQLLAAFPQYPAVVEFRHNSWITERVLAGLDARGAGICMTDMPAKSSLPHFTRPAVTGGTGYFRYHGRNSDTWYASSGGNGSSRYDYAYTEQELAETVPLIEDLAGRSKITLVFFNNHPKGNAAKNAEQMQEIVGHDKTRHSDDSDVR